MHKLTKIPAIFLAIFTLLLNSCGGKSFPSAKDQPVNADERVKKNIGEGRGLKFSTSLGGKGSTNFMFASSNPLWRATLEKLDFIPLANVDYAGGVIITDWYGEAGNNEELKVAIRFLTNEIRSDALNVTIYKRKCIKINSCQTSKIESNLNNEIKTSILKRAAILKKEAESKKDE
tara:strand:- start:13 stop:540 length:528 start_codon:yes stop_codon:yes gene_type:complete